MQYAISIRFGGMPISASECDYNSFHNHGLRCPDCGGTVFLVRQASREKHSRKLKSGESVDVSGSEIPAHFSHHNSESREVIDCELKARRMDPQRLERIQTQARGQIARKFRSKFYSMLKTSIKGFDLGESDKVLCNLWQAASIKNPTSATAELEFLIEALTTQFALPQQRDNTKRGLGDALDRWVQMAESETQRIPTHYRDRLINWVSVLDRKMQVMISCEAIDYVCQNSQRPVLKELIRTGLFCWIVAEARCGYSGLRDGQLAKRAEIYNELIQPTKTELLGQDFQIELVKACRILIGMGSQEFESVFYFVRDDVAQLISFVNWGEEFDSREVI